MVGDSGKGVGCMKSENMGNSIREERIINGWGLTYNATYPVSTKKKLTNVRQSFAVKICPKCNLAYEVERITQRGRLQRKIHYYKDFPRIGLYRILCAPCKK